MSKKYDKFLRNEQWLYHKYHIERLSTYRIAKIVGCSYDAVRWALKRKGISRRPLSEASNGKTLSEQHKRKIGEAGRGRHHSEATKQKIGNVWRGRKHSKEAKRKISEANKNPSEETRQKLREARKHQKFPTHHTKPELVFERFCKKDSLPFRYTGDGSFWIGKGRDAINPDFMHLKKKIVVEIFSYHHDELQRHCKVRYSQTYEGRKKILKKYGYKMIVFWQDDLEREDAEARVLSVLKKHKSF